MSMSFESSRPGHHGVPFRDLIPNNARWAADVLHRKPDFFRISAEGQSPKTLWIGCSDSRVPESVITESKPGDIFVQRNIANLFHLNDANAQSVLVYAVNYLKVKHVVVVGHTHCGGCEAALVASVNGPDAPAVPFVRPPDASGATADPLPHDAPINIWLAPLVRLAHSLRCQSLGKVDLTQLVIANVRAQVEEIRKSSTIRENTDVEVHGWVYHLDTGKLVPTTDWGNEDKEVI